jgi:uncharacterized sporulation protein YeaH/YhbH (DUF444 family)
MTRRLITALVAAAVLAGCGGGGDDEALSTDEYRKQARQICQDAGRETQAIEQPTKATNPAIADYFERLVASNERSTDRFRELEPPEELAKAHEDAVKANEEGAAEVRKVIGELEKGGDAREVLTKAQATLESLNQRADDAAKRLGVPECAQSPSR